MTIRSPLQAKASCITTYQKNGSPIPSFAGEPLRVDTGPERCRRICRTSCGKHLNEDNKVSLFVRSHRRWKPAIYEDVILNKYNTVEG